MDDESARLYEPFLSRGGKLVERSDVSLGDSGRYMRWIAETLADSFDRRRRPPLRLLIELIPVLTDAAEKAEKAGELQQYRESNEEAAQAYEKARNAALNSLLSGFGLIPEEGGTTGNTENKGGRGRRAAASFWEVIKFMDELKSGNEAGLSTNKAAEQAADTLKIGKSTAKKYWKKYEDTLKNHGD